MRTLLAITLLVSCSASAQNNWVDAGMPYLSYGVRQLYTDTVEDQLVACGLITLSNNFNASVLATYSDGEWDTLGVFGGSIRTAIRYGDTLLVGGSFLTVDGINIQSIAAWYSDGWHTYGLFGEEDGSIRKFRVINGTLYAVGYFQNLDGSLCHGVAKRVADQWENVGVIDYATGDEPIVLDVCEYLGNIVVGGEMNPIGLGNDLIQYDGDNWVDLGGGLMGGVGAVTAMAVYQNELYVGGGLYVGSGSPGHGLARWNGSEWNDVGGSMRDIYGTTNYNASASSLLVHEDKLLVGGAFGYAGTVHADQFAIWDGQNWCATGDSIGALVESMAFYHDTLFITCSDTLNEEPANYIARWTGGAFEQICEQVGIAERYQETDGTFGIGASDGHGRTLFGLPDGNIQLQVFDATGRQIASRTVSSSGGRALLDRFATASGLYLVRATGPGYIGVGRFISDPLAL